MIKEYFSIWIRNLLNDSRKIFVLNKKDLLLILSEN